MAINRKSVNITDTMKRMASNVLPSAPKASAMVPVTANAAKTHASALALPRSQSMRDSYPGLDSPSGAKQ